MVGVALSLMFAHSPGDVAFILFGSLLPDIDHPRSTLGRWNVFTRFMTHRGHCHSLIGCVLLSLPFLLGGWSPFVFVLAGALGHIGTDRVTALMPGKKSFKLKVW